MSDSDLSPPPDVLEVNGFDCEESTAPNPAKKKSPSTSRDKKRGPEELNASTERSKRKRTGPRPKYLEVDELVEEEEVVIKEETPKKARNRANKQAKADPEAWTDPESVKQEELELGPELKEKRKRVKAKVKKTVEEVIQVEEQTQANGTVETKVKRKRKTKEEKEAEMLPLAARTVGSKVLVGAHVSAAGGVHNTIMNSHHIGGNAFALFLKSQRKWENPPMKPEHCESYISHCKEHGFTQDIPPIVPHGSYLVNLCHPSPDRAEQSYNAFIDDLDRCRRLGIKLYNFHPGNCIANTSKAAAIEHLAAQLNRAHADPRSGGVVTLLETMAAVGGNTVGAAFEDLRDAIALVADKARVGICLDTCHAFAAGHDVRTAAAWDTTMRRLDEVVGLRYLRALHVNDSKASLASGRDLHANIGTGFLGLRAFHNIVNDSRVWGLPLILETPIERKDEATGKMVEDKRVWAREIKLLESLVGMDVESDEFREMEESLWKQGQSERERIQGQVDKREEKRKKDAAKGNAKRKRKGRKTSSTESELSELSYLSEEDVGQFTQKLK